MLRGVNREDIYYIKENVHDIYEEKEYQSGIYTVHCYVETPIGYNRSVVRRVDIGFPDYIDPSKVDFLSCNVNISTQNSGFYWTTVPIRIKKNNEFPSTENWYVRKIDSFPDDGGHGYLKNISYGCINAYVQDNQIKFSIIREARIDNADQSEDPTVNVFSKISSIEVTYKKKSRINSKHIFCPSLVA